MDEHGTAVRERGEPDYAPDARGKAARADLLAPGGSAGRTLPG